MKLYAEYLGEQDDGAGGTVSLYNITDLDNVTKLDGSTVTMSTLLKYSIPVKQ